MCSFSEFLTLVMNSSIKAVTIQEIIEAVQTKKVKGLKKK